MELLIEIVKFLMYSIVIVLVSKYILVRILRKIGELLNLSSNEIGNIAGIATSIPEFLTVSFSAFTGLISTSFYNIISSNIINTVQYVTSIILNKNQKVIRNKAIKTDLILVVITIIIPIVMVILNFENNFIIVPIFILLMFLFYKITNNAHKLYMPNKVKQNEEKNEKEWNIQGQGNNKDSKNKKMHNGNLKKNIISVIGQVILLLVVGIVLYIVGNLLSDVLNNLCIRFRIPEIIIGVLLGFITSIPELITFFESQKHHEDDKEGVIEATNNLLTSNIMNLFVIQSIGICIYIFVSR